MDLTVLHLAVPALSAELAPSSVQLLWIIDIYGFLVAGSLITMGALGDRIGRRRLLLMGAAAFGVGSLLAAFSQSAEMLIATRALLGLAGATIAPSTLSLIRNMFLDARQRTLAISIWMASYSLGGALGPLLGGLLLEYFWWGSVFLINVPVMLLLLFLGPRLLPEYRAEVAAGRLDLVSAALSLSSVLALIGALKQLAQDGLAGGPLLLIALGLALGVLFVRRQLTLSDPVIDLRLFRSRAFALSLSAYGFAILVLFGGFLFLPQYLQLVRGLSALRSGLWTLPYAASFVAGSVLTPLIAPRVKGRVLMTTGASIASGGFLWLTRLDAETSFVAFACSTVVFALGLAPVFTLTTDVIVGSAPAERAGAAAAMSETSAELGAAMGIALFGSLGVAAYRATMSSLARHGAAQELEAHARATLGSTLALARELPAPLGDELARAAREAFLAGLHLCAAVSAVGSLLLAAVVACGLRRQPEPVRDS